jgi:tetratricopeptide (TPR) repeat protein
VTLQRPAFLGLILFFGSFALYLHTAGPTVLPYRDAGEMATSVPTLGVLHPTSYPVYSITGRLFSALPLGNPAYRLNVFSSIAMAGAWVFLFATFSILFGIDAAFVAVILGLFSYEFWWHALVSEMYALHVCFIGGILLALARRRMALAAFLFGVGLANRSDLLLCLPAFLAAAWPSPDERIKAARSWFYWIGLSVLGLALYLYLPLRALQQPWMNWNDPSTWDAFLRSILRRGYGGTLDLLSTSYAMGENFLSEFTLYLAHLGRDFAWVGVPLALLGLSSLWFSQRRWFYTVLLGFVVTGPVFIFLGNLPANPHALAIMEAAYLMPDVFFLFAVAAGIAAVRKFSKEAFIAAGIVMAAAVVLMTVQSSRETSKRDNFLADDYFRNSYHAIPPGAMIVGRSDVPIFSLYYGHWIAGFHDRLPIAQALAGSPWYQRMLMRQEPGLLASGLKTADDWSSFAGSNAGRPLFAMPDIDWPANGQGHFSPSGFALTYELHPKADAEKLLVWQKQLDALTIQRGVYRYGAHRDFFSNELIEASARSHLALGSRMASPGFTGDPVPELKAALALKPDMPYPAFQLGYLYFLKGDYAQAEHYDAWASVLFERMLADAKAWNSFASAQESIRQDASEVLVHRGVICERLHQPDRALADYTQALALAPENADARYNSAVIYWNKGDWKAVVEHLQALARAHPNDPRWKSYLPRALAHLSS